jgi:small redox-active disulfide protein 2
VKWEGINSLSGNVNSTKFELTIMTKIEILGTGCAKCKRLFANAEQAVKDLKITAEVVKVEDLAEIVGRGIMIPPALFINGEVRAEGRIPDVNEIRKMLTEQS